MANNDSPLEKAVNGEKLSDKQAQGALSEAMNKMSTMGGRLSKLKDHMGNLSDALIHTGEMQATVFMASFAEGYFGEEKMDLGPVDMRTVGGIATGTYGMYNILTGKGGEHALSVGNGLLATGVSRIGRNAGKALREKSDKDKPKDPKANNAAPAPGGQPAPAAAPPAGDGPKVGEVGPKGLPDGDFGDLVRDILLTPGERTEGRHGGAPERSRPSRFIRVSPQ